MDKEFEKLRDFISELTMDDEVLLFDRPSYATAFIGLTEDNTAVYDFDKMIKYLVDKDGMDAGDAIDFIEYNTIRALPYYDKPPLILYPIDREDWE
jgi:hypothetical protein